MPLRETGHIRAYVLIIILCYVNKIHVKVISSCRRSSS